MKYFLRVLLVLVLAVAVVFGVYYANSRGNTTRQNSDVALTTVTKAPVTELKEDKVLLAKYDEGFALYKQGDKIILKDSEGEYSFDNWSPLITRERPTLYYSDFDKDKEKELIFEIASKELDGGKFEHNLYYLDKTQGKYDNEKNKYTVTLISNKTWNFILNELLTEEMTQLKCDKIVQFAMASNLDTIRYDKKTGLNKNSYGGYFKALQNKETGEYYKVKSWHIKNGEAYVDRKNKICVKVYITVTYHGTDQVQEPGYIYTQLTPKNDGFVVTPRTMVFNSTDDSKVSPQHNISLADWAATLENTNESLYTAGDNVIDWVRFSMPHIETVSYEKYDFSTNDTEAKNLVAIEATNSGIKLIAKNGYVFDEKMVQRRDFKVIINKDWADEFGENEISYTGKIYTDQNNRQVLEIQFDKSYPRGEVHTLDFYLPAQ